MAGAGVIVHVVLEELAENTTLHFHVSRQRTHTHEDFVLYP